MWNLKKNGKDELIYKMEIDRRQTTNLQLPKGKGGQGGVNKEFEVNRYTLLCEK